MTRLDVFNTLMHIYFPGQKLNAQTAPQFEMVEDLANYWAGEGNPEGFFNYIGETLD